MKEGLKWRGNKREQERKKNWLARWNTFRNLFTFLPVHRGCQKFSCFYEWSIYLSRFRWVGVINLKALFYFWYVTTYLHHTNGSKNLQCFSVRSRRCFIIQILENSLRKSSNLDNKLQNKGKRNRQKRMILPQRMQQLSRRVWFWIECLISNFIRRLKNLYACSFIALLNYTDYSAVF